LNPSELRYSKEHEWLRRESDGLAVIGITEFAAESLGDVVFVELPPAGTDFRQAEKMGEVESVKAVSDLYTPVSGRVVERNDELVERPELVNESPYDEGWMLRVEMEDPAEFDGLLTSEQYEAFLDTQAK
jgi:glycine cleavage system H protein